MSKWGDFILSHITLRNRRKSDRLAQMCVRRCKTVLGILKKREKELRTLQKRVDSVTKVLLNDLEESEDVIENLKNSLVAVQSELQIADEVTIPALVQASKLVLERTTASTTKEVQKQVINTVPRLEE